MLPLIGRIADLRGRVPVLVMALVVFALGSLVTALAYDMPSIVVGRFLQGVGGGGLVPATLALVADLYPAHRRGVPLGIVSAVQELGSVIGPLFGALVLSVADWRAIFAINLAVGLVLAAAIRTLAPGAADRRDPASGEPRPRPDYLGAALLLVTLVAGRPRVRPPVAAHAGPDLGPAVHPVLRRRPLADPGGRGRAGRRAPVRGPLPDRPPTAGRPPRAGGAAWSRPTCRARCCWAWPSPG